MLYEQGVLGMHLLGDTLYLPGPDSQGSWQWGNVYLYNGHQWMRKETVPEGVHVFDLTHLAGDLYCTGGRGDLFGAIWRSGDGGDTFETIYELPHQGDTRRCYAAGQFQNRVFFQPDGREPLAETVLAFDGADWDTLAVPGLPVDKQGLFTAWGDSLLLTIADRMFVYDGAVWHAATKPFNGNRWCRDVYCYRDTLYGGSEEGRLYRWRPELGWEPVGQLGLEPEFEQIEALVNYYGRLYAATFRTGADTTYNGRLYVSAAQPWGRLESAVIDFGRRATDGVLIWDDFVPIYGDNRVRLQVRSTPTEADLPGEDWRGPDELHDFFEVSGTPLAGWHSGDRYFQYAVELECPYGTRMPLLRSVTLEVDSLPQAGVPPDPTFRDARPPGLALGPPRPSLARTHATFILERPSAAWDPVSPFGDPSRAPGRQDPVRLRIFDVAGRLIRQVDLGLPLTERLAWTWDLRDGAGRRVPAGPYEIVLQQRGVRSAPAPARGVLVLP